MDLLEIGLGGVDWIGLAPGGCTTGGLSSGTQLHRVSSVYV
jgi:hypothetical protein